MFKNPILRFIDRHLSWLNIPYIAYIVAAMPLLPLFLQVMGWPSYILSFDPDLIMSGEVWRLLAVRPAASSLIWIIIYAWFVYIITEALVGEWGESILSVYVLLSYLCGVIAGFMFYPNIQIWYFVTLNISLAFGTLFPDYVFYLYFIIPLKAKWLAIVSGVIVLIQMFMGSVAIKMSLILVLIPYTLFLGIDLLKNTIENIKQAKRRQEFK